MAYFTGVNNFIVRRKNYGLNMAVLLLPIYLLNVIRKGIWFELSAFIFLHFG